MTKARAIVELDDKLLKEIDRIRDPQDTLPVLLGVCVKLGFEAMKLLAWQGWTRDQRGNWGIREGKGDAQAERSKEG